LVGKILGSLREIGLPVPAVLGDRPLSKTTAVPKEGKGLDTHSGGG
jgi:hypothetical protein